MEHFTNKQKIILLLNEYNSLKEKIVFYEDEIKITIYRMQEEIDNMTVEEINNDIDYMSSIQEYINKLEEEMDNIKNEILSIYDK